MLRVFEESMGLFVFKNTVFSPF